eukprot:scaffold57831_cov72-Phaeocystis_antarctica.AAC.5
MPISLCGGSAIRRDHGGAGASTTGPCVWSGPLLAPSSCFTASILLSSAICGSRAGAACEGRHLAGGWAQGHRRKAGRAD